MEHRSVLLGTGAKLLRTGARPDEWSGVGNAHSLDDFVAEIVHLTS